MFNFFFNFMFVLIEKRDCEREKATDGTNLPENIYGFQTVIDMTFVTFTSIELYITDHEIHNL